MTGFRRSSCCICGLGLALLCGRAAAAGAATTIRIMPPDRSDFAVGQRFDLRVEATGDPASGPPSGLRVFVDGVDVTARNLLDPGAGGERGAGGTGTTGAQVPRSQRASAAPAHTTNFLLRGQAFARPGEHTIRARTADGAERRVTLRVHAWQAADRGVARARNIIFLLGDGMGAAHRTAARIVSRGMRDGKSLGPLAMDTLEVTGMVMTSSLNAFVTDSSPGMSAYSTGSKANNNQEGVFPDNTPDAFDNPRVEYIGELLHRTRGPGFRTGLVTTADLTDATPAANAVHTANRSAGADIAARLFDERSASGLDVLLGGGARYFRPAGVLGGERKDGRDVAAEFAAGGYQLMGGAAAVRAALAAPRAPARILGLFHHTHLPVAFDKVGAGTYSRELENSKHAEYRDPPMLEDMARLALASLAAHARSGFYLLIEGASIDKQAHAVDAERMIWDTIEFDRAVQVALDFARRTNADADPANDTLVVVASDHETGGLGLIGVGNERYAPAALGRAVRDYAAVFRFEAAQTLDLVPNYAVDGRGFPTDPDPTRKILLAWAAAPDRYENWVSNRVAADAAVRVPVKEGADGKVRKAVANPARDAPAGTTDNTTADGRPIPGFEVKGVIENGELSCLPPACPGDTSSDGHHFSGHTASDVPISVSGPGALQFNGTYENTDVFLKMLRASTGHYVRVLKPGPRARLVERGVER
jgi:alkaline phosphatase